MKKVLCFTLMAGILCFNLNAQLAGTSLAKDPQFKIVALGGLAFPYTDVQSREIGHAFGIGAAYSPMHYLEIGIDFQMGLLQEGHHTHSPLGGKYKNDFLNTSVILRLNPIQLVEGKNKALQKYLNITIGGGISLFKSDVDALNTYNASLGYIENYNELDILIPFEIGYSIPIYSFYMGQKIALGAYYRYYFSTTDKLDGYQPTVESNKSKDVFSQLNFSISYSF